MKRILTQKIDWAKVNGMIPSIVQDENTGKVLMLGYMNKTALTKTIKTNCVWFYSRTKKRLWMKGETSGNILNVKNIYLDCDNDTLLIKATNTGPTCHTGETSCFTDDKNYSIENLHQTILNRKVNPVKNSYTTSLFSSGLDKICLKVAEESLEVVQAATKETKKRLIEESVDLFYHFFVLLVEKSISTKDIEKEIGRRMK